MRSVPFRHSVRLRFYAATLLLLLIPLSGMLFVRELALYLRGGQEQVVVATAKLLASMLSDRPEVDLRASNRVAADTERSERELVLALFASGEPGLVAGLGDRFRPDAAVSRALQQIPLPAMRIWVIDAAANVRALTGSLSPVGPVADTAPDAPWREIDRFVQHLLRRLTPAPAIETETGTDSAAFSLAQYAVNGQPSRQWHAADENAPAILTVAEPVFAHDSIVGALVIEQADDSTRNVARQAAQIVAVMTLLVLIVAFGVLVGFSLRLTRRLGRLQREVDAAIDPQGRVRGTVSAAIEPDELGALSRSIAAMVARQTSYTQYLEALAGRLSHELRTPVSVVRSSLDNLRAARVGEEQAVYLERAEAGVQRLATIVSRMSEAARLERMLDATPRLPYDIVPVVRGAVEGYRSVYGADVVFELHVETAETTVCGSPDALMQLLDKLVQNATDFALPASPIEIRIDRDGNAVMLTVANRGPTIAEERRRDLFNALVSSRAGSGAADMHLGLGLYIARLVAEHHGGRIQADNLPDGVAMCVRLPLHATTRV